VGPIVHVVRFSPGQLIQILKQKSKIESNLEKNQKNLKQEIKIEMLRVKTKTNQILKKESKS
jgi:hypothetical protein